MIRAGDTPGECAVPMERQIHSCHSPLPESAAQSRREKRKEENENETGEKKAGKT